QPAHRGLAHRKEPSTMTTTPDTQAQGTAPAAKATTAKPKADSKAKAAAAAKRAKASTAKANARIDSLGDDRAASLRAITPEGYQPKWPHGSYLLVAKIKGSPALAEDASPWLVICTAHGTQHPVGSAKDGDAAGTKAGRAAWCRKCKAQG